MKGSPRFPKGLRLPQPDQVLSELDNALRTLFAPAYATKPAPGEDFSAALGEDEKRLSTQLMRVNHAGEVCAQALYRGQMAVAQDGRVKALLERAAEEETEHLAWTEQRLAELGGRKSVLNPLWYLNSFAIGVVSGLAGDRWSLGFLAETEAQLQSDIQELEGKSDPNEAFETINVKPKKTNISVQLLAFVWAPYWNDESGKATPAWE